MKLFQLQQKNRKKDESKNVAKDFPCKKALTNFYNQNLGQKS